MKLKKSLFYFFAILLIINFISHAFAEDIPINVPIVGNINTESGLPDSFEKFRAMSENLSEEESRKQYLYQEWTKLAKNDRVAAIFFYTDMFFSAFDPIWENIFGIKFSWSWEFIFCLVIWIILIVIIYMPVKELFNANQILTIIISIIISSLVGKSGVIKQSADTLTFAVKNIWIAVICLIIAIIITAIYSIVLKKFGHDLKKQSEEEELERAKKAIKMHGKLSEKALKEM
jgi:hypothetical protein